VPTVDTLSRLRDDLSLAAREVRETCLAFRVRRLNRRVTRIYDAVLRPFDVTIAQFNMLVALGLGLDLRAGDLSRALDLEKSTVSRNVKRLADRHLVSTVADGRALKLTAAGKRLVARALPAWREAQREAAVAIDADLMSALRRGALR
jgi:DNA-binding MarR family transcriptional regulator